jgi:innexin
MSIKRKRFRQHASNGKVFNYSTINGSRLFFVFSGRTHGHVVRSIRSSINSCLLIHFVFVSILFYIPNLIWQSLMTRSGLDLKDIIEAGKSYKSIDRMDKRRKVMDYIIASIDEFIDDPRRGRENRNLSLLKRIQAVFCCMYGKFQGNYFMMVYLLTKMLYVINSIGQLILLNEMLGIKYYRYGLELIQKLLLLVQNQPIQQSYRQQGGLSKYFPKVTLCDFE